MTPHPLIVILRDARRKAKIPAATLAKRIGWSRHTISAAERGRTTPTITFLDDYAAGLGMTVALVEDLQIVQSDAHRAEPRRACARCGVPYQVTRSGNVRKHGCMVKEDR